MTFTFTSSSVRTHAKLVWLLVTPPSNRATLLIKHAYWPWYMHGTIFLRSTDTPSVASVKITATRLERTGLTNLLLPHSQPHQS